MRTSAIVGLVLSVAAMGVTYGASYGGGNGTADDPYLIYTPEQMQELGDNPEDWDKDFKLMADLDLSTLTAPLPRIGTWWVQPFTGIFDGNGHTISNFSASGSVGVGLFGYVYGSEIRDLGMIDVCVFGGAFTGGLVGCCDWGNISGCYVTGQVSGSEYGDWIGGLVGDCSGDMSDCYSEADIVCGGDYFFAGGLAGRCSNMSNCYATGDVTGCDYAVGGLVGACGGRLSHCYATGRVSGQRRVGGLVGVRQRHLGLLCHR